VDSVEAAVVGGGVVGLAVARALARSGLETVLLEAAPAPGTVTSARNSEVIHAGIYYAPGSSKARLCTAGRERLYAYCVARGIEHRRCGKLLVAVDEAQRADLARMRVRGLANGVVDLQWLESAEMNALEPAVAGVAGLLSPSTGIVDSHGLMLALRGDFEGSGGALAVASPVEAIDLRADGHVLTVGGDAPMELAASIVVNAAGLSAPELASRMHGLALTSVPEARYAKGNYFALGSGRAPFKRLIYPLPEAAGLGIHLTLDLAGLARFGPDVEWITPASAAAIDYRVDPARAAAFEAAIRRYWPGLPLGALLPAYSGVRPKIFWQGAVLADFMVQGPKEHGVAGLVNLFGIESPGLTACLALADEVCDRLGVDTSERTG
jgi:L-2-hydroxyglutarate oxidase LhgO